MRIDSVLSFIWFQLFSLSTPNIIVVIRISSAHSAMRFQAAFFFAICTVHTKSTLPLSQRLRFSSRTKRSTLSNVVQFKCNHLIIRWSSNVYYVFPFRSFLFEQCANIKAHMYLLKEDQKEQSKRAIHYLRLCIAFHSIATVLLPLPAIPFSLRFAPLAVGPFLTDIILISVLFDISH